MAPRLKGRFLRKSQFCSELRALPGAHFTFLGDEDGKKLSVPSQLLDPLQHRVSRTRPRSLYQGGNSILRHESGLRGSTASSEIGDLRSCLRENVSKCSRTSHAG